MKEAPVAVAPVRNGRGLIAVKSVQSGATILRVHGRIVHYELLWRRQGSKFAANCFRYGPDTYLDPGDGVARFVNHSCEPNAGIRKVNNQLFLFAARKIGRGAEITIDYSTTIGDDDIWRMRCNCGRRSCRKVVRNFGSLPAAVRERYLSRGLVPGYIIRTLADGAPAVRWNRVSGRQSRFNAASRSS
ncbi:MAG TPA: SET domain-containing protein-lysine N-methyltransferase [Gemmatimonadaceae bacterium]